MPVPIVAPRPMVVSAQGPSTCFRRLLSASSVSTGRTVHIWRSTDGRFPAPDCSTAFGMRAWVPRARPLACAAPVSHSPGRLWYAPAPARVRVLALRARRALLRAILQESFMSPAANPRATPPADGAKITITNGKLSVPDNPILPFIEGDGTGPDIWRAAVRVMDAAVAKSYGGKRRIRWMEVYAGEKANKLFQTWLPDETVAACREYLVSIQGPLTTPGGGGIRSLNVALRQMLDLYVCLRPVRWFKGVPSPVKHPEKVDMVIFRENTEDIYAGIEFE